MNVKKRWRNTLANAGNTLRISDFRADKINTPLLMMANKLDENYLSMQGMNFSLHLED